MAKLKRNSRKAGRAKVKCALYRQLKKREKNKIHKLKKLICYYPNDKQMANVIKKLERLLQ